MMPQEWKAGVRPGTWQIYKCGYIRGLRHFTVSRLCVFPEWRVLGRVTGTAGCSMRGSLPSTSPSIFTARAVPRGNVPALNTTSLNVMSLDGTSLLQGRRIPVLRVACSFCPLRSLHGLIFSQVFFQVLPFLFDNFLAQYPQN
jgi:hypothetical protein